VPGVQTHPKSFELAEISAQSQKIWAKKLRQFLTTLMKLYFFVIECAV